MQTATTPVAADETDRLIAADKVVGRSVYNLQGEHLGSRTVIGARSFRPTSKNIRTDISPASPVPASP
jgi:hypothetical protein